MVSCTKIVYSNHSFQQQLLFCHSLCASSTTKFRSKRSMKRGHLVILSLLKKDNDAWDRIVIETLLLDNVGRLPIIISLGTSIPQQNGI